MAAGKNGGLRRGMPAIALERLDERRLLSDDVGPGAPREGDVDAEVRAHDVLADVALGVRIVERSARRSCASAISPRT
jgi:hypothetical protein